MSMEAAQRDRTTSPPPPLSPGHQHLRSASLDPPKQQQLEIADSRQQQQQQLFKISGSLQSSNGGQKEEEHRVEEARTSGEEKGDRHRQPERHSREGVEKKQERISDSGFWCCFSCDFGRKKRDGMGGSNDGDEDVASADLRGVVNADALPRPEHLVILVNGILGSANDWKFAAQRLKTKLGRRVAIHSSEASSALKTFDGVDVMGKRLASEVLEIIDKTPGVTKISFLAHSLGGLITRYAIAELYCPPMHSENFGEGVTDPSVNSKITTEAAQSEATIGGLQAENFITLATPHLGCRGGEQLPFLFGIGVLEKTASFFAPWVVGRTGKHLFLTDGSRTELPLLRKMATDCKEGQFISSLGLFKKRAAYANVAHDQLVGWRTASIRRKSELPEIRHEPLDPRYPHVISEEEPVPPSVENISVGPSLEESGRPAGDALEEEMVAGLTQVPWYRVDASFRGARSSAQAHNLIQVKTFRFHFEGKDVIEHVIDKNFVREESI